jgi:hypothetical protein
MDRSMLDSGEVKEAVIEELLAAELVIREEMQWKRRDIDRRIRLKLEVANRLGESLWLHMGIPLRVPWQYSLALVWNRLPVRRLDVRGSHVNQCDGSGQRWNGATHKHKWRDEYRDGWAYTPNDIPPTPGTSLGQNEHRQVFEAFCLESKVRVETDWVEPQLRGFAQETIGGG